MLHHVPQGEVGTGAVFRAKVCFHIYPLAKMEKWKWKVEKKILREIPRPEDMESWGIIKTPAPPPHTWFERYAKGGAGDKSTLHLSYFRRGGGAGSLHGKISGSIKFGGSLEAHQNSGVEVPGSNPASPTMILMRCRITAKNVENLRVERETYRWGKKERRKN